MEIGFSALPTDYSMDIATLAKRVEELGFGSLWVPEHPVLPVHSKTKRPGYPPGPIPEWYAYQADPFVSLARASAVTATLKLGTGVCIVPERSPLVLAKEVATLDMFSGGRFLFGIGAGWLKEESAIMGVDFSRRWARTREAVLAMKELWTKTASEFHGKYFDFPPVYSFPMPAQRPHPPVLIGSKARRVFERVVEYGDGWFPIRVTPEDVRQGRATLNELAEKSGRDPRSLSITVFGLPADPNQIRRFEDAGADRTVVPEAPWPGSRDNGESLAELERIAEKVLS